MSEHEARFFTGGIVDEPAVSYVTPRIPEEARTGDAPCITIRMTREEWEELCRRSAKGLAEQRRGR